MKLNTNQLDHAYKELEIPMIQQLLKKELMKISYRYMYNLLSVRIVNLFEHKNHGYNTRNRSAPNIKKHGTKKYNDSFLTKAPSMWLTLPTSIKSVKNVKVFSKSVQKHLLN